jgi:hypothetical protein
MKRGSKSDRPWVKGAEDLRLERFGRPEDERSDKGFARGSGITAKPLHEERHRACANLGDGSVMGSRLLVDGSKALFNGRREIGGATVSLHRFAQRAFEFSFAL